MSLTVDKCLQAWSNSLRQMNAKADIVFFGDSLTYYGDFASVFPGKVVCNLGLRGDTIKGMIERVEQVKMLEPKLVFLMAGINDVATLDYITFGNMYDSLLSRIKCVVPEKSVFVQTLLPVNDKDFSVCCNNEQIVYCNQLVRQVAIKHKLTTIDLFSVYERDGYLPKIMTIDGIHLYSVSYQAWYNCLKENCKSI